MRQVILEEGRFADETAFHEYVKEALGFPAYYGANWAAFSDCLEDVDEPTRLVFASALEASAWFAKATLVAGRVAGENPQLEVVDGTAAVALARLARGNDAFLAAGRADGNVSPALRARLFERGQHPIACVVACSDSRVVPEAIFSCGLGELFCIRTAGNTIGANELASVVYACGHLGVRLVMVLGHTGCGAVAAALEGSQEEAIACLTGPISEAIDAERDPDAASALNARAGAAQLCDDPKLAPLLADGDVRVLPALYRTDSGKVDFL